MVVIYEHLQAFKITLKINYHMHLTCKNNIYNMDYEKMKFNYIKKLITIGTAAAIFLAGCNSGSTGSANTKNTNLANAKIASMNDSTDTGTFQNTDSRSSLTQNEENIQLGLMGHYFAKDNFKDQLFQIHHKSNQFGISKNMYILLKDIHEGEQTQERRNVTVKSIYWNGYIKFDTDITTQLVFGIDGTAQPLRSVVQIYIDNILINNRPFEFIAGKYYKLKIAIPEGGDLAILTKANPKLVYGNNHNEYKIVPDKNLFGPNSKFAMTKGIQGYADDSDKKDDVIKSNALSGFVVVPEDGHIVYKGWMPAYYAKRYQKLYSNVDKGDTTLGSASPWKDQQKIDSLSNTDDLGISYDALNPVVAAYPIISPLIDSIQVAKNQSIAKGKSNSSTTGTEQRVTNSKVHEVTNGNSINVGANLGGSSKEGANAGLNFSYSHNWGTNDTTTTGSDLSNSLSLMAESNTSTTINTNDYANIQLSMFYKNVGTAAISGFQPSFDIAVLKDNKLIPAMQSIFKNENRVTAYIAPWAIYPNNNVAQTYTAGDDFNGTKIGLTQDNFNLLSSFPIVVGTPALFTTGDKIDWNDTVGKIKKQTALFILRTPKADIERRVFGLDPQKAELQRISYPELTLRDAFYVAFQLIQPNMKDKSWKYDSTFNVSNYSGTYSFESLQVLSDENTFSNMEKQKNSLKEIESDIIDTYKIRATMQFILSPTGWVTNEATQAKSYATLQHGFYRNEAAEIEGKGYVFDANGELVTTPGIFTTQDGFQINEKKYYVGDNNDHSLENGWKIINKDRYFFDLQNYQAKKNEWVIQDNKCQKGDKYYIGNDYKLLSSGFTTIEGNLYFLSPASAYYISFPKDDEFSECRCYDTITEEGNIPVSKPQKICNIRGDEYLGAAWKNVPIPHFPTSNAFVPPEYVNVSYTADESGTLRK